MSFAPPPPPPPGDDAGETGCAEPASAEELVQLRRAQLQEMCRAAGLQTGGNKAEQAARLVGRGWSRDAVAAMRQTFLPEAAKEGSGGASSSRSAAPKRPATAKASPPAKRRATAVRAAAAHRARRKDARCMSDDDLHRLLWAVENGRLRCRTCASLLRQRQGRFGLYLLCSGAPECSSAAENILAALERLGDDGSVVRVVFELEDINSIV